MATGGGIFGGASPAAAPTGNSLFGGGLFGQPPAVAPAASPRRAEMSWLMIEFQDKVRIRIMIRNNIVKVTSMDAEVKIMGDYTCIAVEKLADGVTVPEINCLANEVKIVGDWGKLAMTTTAVTSDEQTISTLMFSNRELSPAKKQRTT